MSNLTTLNALAHMASNGMLVSSNKLRADGIACAGYLPADRWRPVRNEHLKRERDGATLNVLLWCRDAKVIHYTGVEALLDFVDPEGFSEFNVKYGTWTWAELMLDFGLSVTHPAYAELNVKYIRRYCERGAIETHIELLDARIPVSHVRDFDDAGYTVYGKQYTTEHDLSYAYSMIRSKQCVRREAWPAGMYIYDVDGSRFQVNRAPLLGILPPGTEVNYQSHIDVCYGDGRFGVWCPTQEDLHANDYEPYIGA